MIEEALKPLLNEGLLPGVSLWSASFSPFDKTSQFVAFRLHGWEDTQVQIGASDLIEFKTIIPAAQYEEDGEIYDEPESVQNHSYRFLQLESLESRDLRAAATYEIAVGLVEGIDLLYASYDIPFPTGVENRRVIAGIRFRMSEGYHRGNEASFVIIQKRLDEQLYIGPATQMLSDLPAHFEPLKDE